RRCHGLHCHAVAGLTPTRNGISPRRQRCFAFVVLFIASCRYRQRRMANRLAAVHGTWDAKASEHSVNGVWTRERNADYMRPMSMVAYGLANMLCVMSWPSERWRVRRRRNGDGECL